MRAGRLVRTTWSAPTDKTVSSENKLLSPRSLIEHEKAESRPWKCPVESCKFHEYGWPTTGELERHHNDKHPVAPPPLYECLFKPCPYRSKRESNCKQHMEKAHGWTYIRSKNNGKNRGKSALNPPTPQTNDIKSASSDANAIGTSELDDFGLATGYDALILDCSRNLDEGTFICQWDNCSEICTSAEALFVRGYYHLQAYYR